MNQLTELQALLIKSDIFQGLTNSALRDLSTYMTPANFKENDVILEKNTLGDWMFVIKSGEVKVHNGLLTITVLGAGEVIGELSLLKPEVRNMSVTALSDTTTFRITHRDFFAFAEKNPTALTGIITILVDRLRNQTAATLRHFEEREQELTKLVEARTLDLQNKNIELERTQKFKEQFLANMSHEIRTPMNAILGMTNLVLETPLQDKQKKYLVGIQKASNNLLHIINDILDFSKIEAGKMELEAIHFSLRDVVGQVTATLIHKAGEKSLELLSQVSDDVPDILVGDPTRLYQILMNLSGNAIKFTEKGSVQIKAQCISGNKSSDRTLLKFSVIDTGIGIPADKINLIFESFSQAHSSDTRKYGGTGLGLSISKQLVELMGGAIAIESEEGSGTTFSFKVELPLGSRDQLQKQDSGEIDGSILNGLRILLVEDNEDNRIVATDTLNTKAELTVVDAVNGQDAIDKLLKTDFDAILMDVQMPVMDGYEATRYIRTQLSSPKNKTPIIAMTASVIKSDLDKCRNSGMNDYVPKPFKISQLLTTLAKVTGREIRFRHQPELKQASRENVPVPGIRTTDLTYLNEFCAGDKIRMQKYISIFLKNAPNLVDTLNLGLEQENYERIAAQVHGIKPTLMIMGIDQGKNYANELMQLCRSDDKNRELIKKNTIQLIRLISSAIEELKNSN